MARTAGTVIRWTETPRGKVYFGLSTGETVVLSRAGVFVCLTCHRVDCAHGKVAAVEFDRLCASGQLETSRFISADKDAA